MSCAGDGWHRVGPYRVFVEDRVITYCIKQDRNGHPVEAHIYYDAHDRGSRQRWWMRDVKVTLAALRAGLRRGTKSIQ